MGGAGFRYEDNRFYIDLGITAVDFLAPESTWHNALTAISEMLFAATTGQMQLGRLSFCNEGAIDALTDIVIADTPGSDADTPQSSEDEPFVDQITLHQETFQVPLIGLHELGHYLFCLREEYREVPGGSEPRCTCDPRGGACVMEFGAAHSLQLGNDGLPTLYQPTDVVARFCFEDHLDGVAGDVLSMWQNGQHFTYGMSCWHKIHQMFDQRGGGAGRMRLPSDLTATGSVHQAVEWAVLESTSRLAVVILGSSSIQDQEAIAAIRQALIAGARWQLGQKSQFALWTDANSEPIFALDRVTDNDIDRMLDRIEGARFGDSATNAIPIQAIVHAAIRQFRSPATAADTLVLIAPGRMPPTPVAGELANELASRRVRLAVTTFGPGPFAEQWSTIAAANRWVHHTSLPSGAGGNGGAFALQEHLQRAQFDTRPGYGLAGWNYVVLPAEPRRPDPARDGSETSPRKETPRTPSLPDLPFCFDVHPHGVDYPVYVESGAAAAVFVLTVPADESVELAIVTPAGDILQMGDRGRNLRTVDSAGIKSIEVSATAELPLAGRWIFRVFRRDAEREMPLSCGIYVQNRAVFFDASTQVSPNPPVKFRGRVFHREVLDQVDLTVQVFRVADMLIGPEPFRTAVLSRSVSFDRAAGNSQGAVSGTQLASLELPPGDYLAILRATHAGGAVRLLDTGRPAKPGQPLRKVEPVPSFTRLQISRFTVT